MFLKVWETILTPSKFFLLLPLSSSFYIYSMNQNNIVARFKKGRFPMSAFLQQITLRSYILQWAHLVSPFNKSEIGTQTRLNLLDHLDIRTRTIDMSFVKILLCYNIVNDFDQSNPALIGACSVYHQLAQIKLPYCSLLQAVYTSLHNI